MITRSFQVCHQQYADDTQLFISLNLSDPSSDITNVTSCLHALQSWFCLNGMALNPDKSDVILLGTRQRSRCHASLRSVDVAGCSVSLSDHIKIIGVTLDFHLSFDKHISFICKSTYYHIRSLRHIRSAITDDTANQWWWGCYLMFPFLSVPHRNHRLSYSQFLCFHIFIFIVHSFLRLSSLVSFPIDIAV